MLSYLHRYHAGNFADVHKHLVLCRVLLALQRKATPFCVLDTHAGEGLYDLTMAEPQATGEADAGVRSFMSLTNPPSEVEAYRQILTEMGGNTYPGSPELALRLIRPQDRLLAVELHPQAYEVLKSYMSGEDRVHLHRRDALEALVALTPPAEKRGVAVIDPAYEVKTEYQAVPAAVAKAFARWRNGVFLIWFPLLPEGRHQTLLAALSDADFPEVFVSEWRQREPGRERGMYGSGVALVNPPWQVDQEVNAIGSWLEKAGFQGGHRSYRLTPQGA